ncbi:polyamine ABC transporter substrate-binding protein [Vibrio viridaestus]|nr:spermidine/putrescine ABC transporter substrate-binding protein [Vibrio viridaestus]
MWEDYLSPEVVEQFEQETGNKVSLIYFDTETLRDEVINTGRASTYDLVILDSLTLQMMTERGLLRTESESDLPTLNNFTPESRKLCGNTGVPYMWGTMGIAYRSSLYPDGVDSWMAALQPSKDHYGRITIPVDEIDTTGMALLALKHDPFTSEEKPLMDAFDLLKESKSKIKSFLNAVTYTRDMQDKSQLDLVVAFSGETYLLNQYTGNEDWVYTIPQEGTLIWHECFAQLKDSPNKKATKQFLNFIGDPKIAAKNAEYIWYATSNQSAMDFVSDEYKNDSEIFPDKTALANSYPYREISLPGLKLRTRIISIIQRESE